MSWICSLSLLLVCAVRENVPHVMDIFQFVEQMARIARLSRISDRFVVLTLGPIVRTLLFGHTEVGLFNIIQNVMELSCTRS